MKKLVIATMVAVLAAVAFTAMSVAAPWSGTREAGPTKADVASRLPALPADIRQRRRWKIGVKCDFPPFGYINRQNKIAGYDVDVARRFAELAFGRRNRVSLTCVTTRSEERRVGKESRGGRWGGHEKRRSRRGSNRTG